jgi:ribonucleotide monophosphatase NagD (HAD superfamily)
MIGDNPHSDIEGGKRRGKFNQINSGKNNWKTILVRTGVYKDGDSTNEADFVVNDFEEAYLLILKLENL